MVGGSVRDLLLGGTPRDFDVLTSGELQQVWGVVGVVWCGGGGVGVRHAPRL